LGPIGRQPIDGAGRIDRERGARAADGRPRARLWVVAENVPRSGVTREQLVAAREQVAGVDRGKRGERGLRHAGAVNGAAYDLVEGPEVIHRASARDYAGDGTEVRE